MKAVIDAAALLCVLLEERGAETVIPVLRGGTMSALNLSESYSRGVERGASMEQVERAVRRFEMMIFPFDAADAWEAARLRPLTRDAGCSLGDRACLALGKRLQAPIFTGDRRMASIAQAVDLDIRLVR